MPELNIGRMHALASISIDSIMVCSCKQCQQHLSATKIELINSGSGGPAVSSASGNINPWQENIISASDSVTARLFEVMEPDLVLNLRIYFGNVLNSSHQHYYHHHHHHHRHHHHFPLIQSFSRTSSCVIHQKKKQTSQSFLLYAIQDRMRKYVLESFVNKEGI